MRLLLDTNVASELRKIESGKAAAAFVRWAVTSTGFDHALSVISVMEMHRGILNVKARDPQQARVYELWLAQVLEGIGVHILPVSLEVAEFAARLHAMRTRPELDTLIAATAIVFDPTLITRNTADFADTGARLLNPWLD